MAKKKILVVTATRAESGILREPMRAIRASDALELKLVVTGTHLLAEFGLTKDHLLQDGFAIDHEVPILAEGTGAQDPLAVIATGFQKFGPLFRKENPDLVLVLGDRYELLPIVESAFLLNIPVGHLAGGDISEGAQDDGIRHALTKLSHLHFVTNPDSEKRVLQMGEEKWRVHRVGHPSLDAILVLPRLSEAELKSRLGFGLGASSLLVTYHPTTLSDLSPEREFGVLLDALKRLEPGVSLLFTAPNADAGGDRILAMIRDFVRDRAGAHYVPSLGQELFFNVLRKVHAIVGNSSSGICEACSLGAWTLNVGDRQKGRLRPATVIDCPVDADRIHAGLADILHRPRATAANPYGDGKSSDKIARVLERLPSRAELLHKKFETRFT